MTRQAASLRTADLKHARTGYLYPDGHLVLVHEKPRRGYVRPSSHEWVTIHERAVSVRFTEGRIIFSAGALPLLLHSEVIDAKAPTLEGGSDNSRKAGVAVGHVEFRLKGTPEGFRTFAVHLVPGMISGDLHYQSERTDLGEFKETWEEARLATRWADYEVARVQYAG